MSHHFFALTLGPPWHWLSLDPEASEPGRVPSHPLLEVPQDCPKGSLVPLSQALSHPVGESLPGVFRTGSRGHGKQ